MKTYVEIQRRGEAHSKRELLDASRVALGRSNQARLKLGDASISRMHAEIVCDPFGRWWIRDLGSTNGTVVNGEHVTERVLRQGDAIGIGEFTLRIFTEDGAADAVVSTAAAPGDEGPSLIKRVGDDEQEVRINAAQLSALKSFSRRLLSLERPAERVTALCELMTGEEFRAESVSVIRLRQGTAPAIVAGPCARAGSAPSQRISNAVAAALLEMRAPILGTHEARRFGSQLGIRKLSTAGGAGRLRSVVSCPLEERSDGGLDALYVEVLPDRGTLEWLSLASLAVEQFLQANLVWETRRELQSHAAAVRELEMAQQIQRAYVPKPPKIAGLDINVGFQPCQWVGGDYVDAVATADGRVLLAIADVCGKGLQAAIVASSLHTMVHATLEAGGGPGHLMQRLNAHLCEFLPDDSFVTMSCVVVDPASGEFECFNAGHLPPMVVHSSGITRYLPSATNPPLGILPGQIESHRGRLEPGEVLVQYTDGLTEGRGDSEQMLGAEALGEGVADYLAACPDASSEMIGARLWQVLEDFRGGRWIQDDTTFLVARRIEP